MLEIALGVYCCVFIHSFIYSLFTFMSNSCSEQDDEALLNITQMLVLGLSARDRKNLGIYKLPKEVVASFFPALANAILEAKIYDMSKADDPSAASPAFAPLASFWIMPVARKVILFYLIRRLEEGDTTLFGQFAEFADRTSFSVSSEPALAQSLVSVALHTKVLCHDPLNNAHALQHSEIRTAVIENFLLKRRAEVPALLTQHGSAYRHRAR